MSAKGSWKHQDWSLQYYTLLLIFCIS